MLDIQPVTLAGRSARLEPLSLAHLPGLLRHGLDPDLWTWMPVRVTDKAALTRYVEDALDEQQRGISLPFATLDARTSEVAGSTRYLNIERRQRRVEIGSTWLMRPWQRTALNTEAKYLMLRHAFEHWCCVRVELKTDVRNMRSRQAIQRIGAREEGIFRSHMMMPGGRIRDTAYYSITYSEWPEVKRRLLARMAPA